MTSDIYRAVTWKYIIIKNFINRQSKNIKHIKKYTRTLISLIMRNNVDCHTIDQNSFFFKILNYVLFHCGTTSASWSKTDYPPPWRYHICFKNCRVITQETTHIHTNHFCIRSEDLGMRFFFLQRISVECSPVSSLSLIRDVKVSVDFSICFISLIHTWGKFFMI